MICWTLAPLFYAVVLQAIQEYHTLLTQNSCPENAENACTMLCFSVGFGIDKRMNLKCAQTLVRNWQTYESELDYIS